MISSQATVITARPNNWLMRLCKHFSRKIEVEYGETEGKARFPWGECHLTADDEALRFYCQAEDEAQLSKMQEVVALHVGLLSRRNPVAVDWRVVESGVRQ